MAAAVTVGLLAGIATGGRWRPLVRLRLRWLPALVAGTIALTVPWVTEAGPTAAVIVAGQVALGAFAVANLHLVGMGVVAFGLLAVAVPVAVDGAVVVDAGAAVTAGLADRRDPAATASLPGGYRLAEPGDRLEALGARAPVAPLGLVVSLGDLVVLAGLVDVGFRVTRREGARRDHARQAARLRHPALQWRVALAATLDPRLALQVSGMPRSHRRSSRFGALGQRPSPLGPIDLSDDAVAERAAAPSRARRH